MAKLTPAPTKKEIDDAEDFIARYFPEDIALRWEVYWGRVQACIAGVRVGERVAKSFRRALASKEQE